MPLDRTRVEQGRLSTAPACKNARIDTSWRDEVKATLSDLNEHQAAKARLEDGRLQAERNFAELNRLLDEVVTPTLREVAEMTRGQGLEASVVEVSPVPQHRRAVVLRLGGHGRDTSDLIFESAMLSSMLEVHRVTRSGDESPMGTLSISAITPDSVGHLAAKHLQQFAKGA